MDKSHFKMMARYGSWANQRLLSACTNISADDYYADRNAFFGSIHGTLNHILVGDRIWFGRISGIDSGLTTLGAKLYDTLDGLVAARESEDQRIISIIDEMDANALSGELRYTTIGNSTPMETPMSAVLTHVFNHATHHRGQVHGLLSQVPFDPPSLDLILYLRECDT